MSEPTPKDPRGPTNLRIKFRSASLDQFIARYAADVSRGGIFIRTREPLAVGTRLKLEFTLQDAAPLLAGEGTVVWIREHDPARENVTPGMGVRFDKLTPESQPTLEKILAEKARLEQAGGPATGPAKGGGMAVRRPSGVFASLDSDARAALGAAARAGNDAPTVGPELTPIAVPPAPAVPPPPPPPAAKTSVLGSRSGVPAAPAAPTPSGPFSRARATTTRPVPVPSALFEPPTAADIDKALEALAEVPGPSPGARPTPSVPRYVADDASNEPTRVGDVIDELVGQRPAGSGAPGTAPMTERLAAAASGSESPGAPSAGPTDESTIVLDGPLEIVDEEVQPAVPEAQAAVQAPVAPDPSKRFRAASRAYPTLNSRKRGLTGLIVVVVLLAAGAGVAFKLHLTDRLFRRPAPPAPVAATPPAPTPPAGATPENAAAQPAAAEKAAPEGAGGSGAVAAAPEKTAAPEKSAPVAAEEKPAQKSAAENKKPVAADKVATPPEEHGGKRHPHRRAEAGGPDKGSQPATAAPSAPAEKPAGEKPAEPPPAEKPAAEPSAAGKPADSASTRAAEIAAATAAATAPAPVLKVTSSPSGAQVLIDGKEVGTTPFVSKDVDPAAPHAITIKKDGYEASERMVSGLDWSRPKGNTPQTLKVNAKLRRSAAAAPAAAPAAPKENAEPEDTGGPYIKEIKPDSP